MNGLVVDIPLGIIFIVLTIRLLTIPYEKHKEQQREINDLQKSLDKQRDAEREKLKQRLAPVIKEIVKLKKDLSYSNASLYLIPDTATRYLIQRWLDDANISQDKQNEHFFHYICFPGEYTLARDCYVLLYVEDWISDTHLDWFYRDARTFFLGCIQQMGRASGVKTDIKITTSAITVGNEKLFGSKPFEFFFRYYSLEDCLAKNNEEMLDPTDIVVRVKKAVSDTKDYFKREGFLKDNSNEIQTP